MKNLLKKISTSAVILSALTVAASAADTKSEVKVKTSKPEKFDNWIYQCETMEIAGKKQEKICALVQNFALKNEKTNKEQPVLRLQVHKVKQDKKLVTFLGIRTPLGVDLSGGLKLQIDKKDYQARPFTTCYAEILGCRASFIIDGDLEKALLSGKKLRIGYKALTGNVIASEVKTDGYAKAIAKF